MCWRLYSKILLLPFYYITKIGIISITTKFLIDFYYSLTQYSFRVNFVLNTEKYLFGIDKIPTFVLNN